MDPCTQKQKEQWCNGIQETVGRIDDKVGSWNFGLLAPVLNKVGKAGKVLGPLAYAQGVTKAAIDNIGSYGKDVCREWGIK